MKIGILGTGMVGEGLGNKLVELGHAVKMGSRTANNEKAVAWAGKVGAKASYGAFADAAAFGEIVLIATSGAASVDAVTAAGASNFAGKPVVDISNPLDFSSGGPGLSVAITDSLGEQVQRALPHAHVVKALNTMWVGLMTHPSLLSSDSNVFMAGNDAGAKAAVTNLLKEFGWKESDVVDMGDITGARSIEVMLLPWLRLYNITGNGAFNFKIVR
jgi:8-hydroxy-5-deazaflavin:NADPH oxidoreductase